MKHFFLSQKHKRRFSPYVDTLIYLGGLINPLITFPQLYEIFANQSARDVSLISWTGYLFGAGIWLVYGIVHRERPMIFIYSLAIPIYVGIVVGVLLYGFG